MTTYTETSILAERLALMTGESKADWLSWIPESVREGAEDGD